MIFVNLISVDRPPKKRTVAPLLISLCALFLTGIFYPVLTPSLEAPRTLGGEEKETVIEVLSRIEESHPDLAVPTRAMKDLFMKQAEFSQVETLSEGLIRWADGSWNFSPSFFEADPLTQENSLTQVLRNGAPSLTRK